MDGVDDILDSLEIHSKEESIQEYGIRAINNLAILGSFILLKKGKIYLVEEMWRNHLDATPH